MRTTRTTPYILLLLVTAAACTMAPPPVVEPTHWTTMATATGPTFHGAGANVNASTSPNGTVVTIAYREATGASGTSRPWHVHRGRCGNDMGIVGEASAYPVLQPGSDGTATATATVTVPLMAGETYFVNVHESPSNLSSIVACGELQTR